MGSWERCEKSHLHDFFLFMEKTFSIKTDGKSDGTLDTQRASDKILYVSVFFGSHWMKEVKCGNISSKNLSPTLNILAVLTICSGNFSSIKNLSPTLALTLRQVFPPKIPQNMLAFRGARDKTVTRNRIRFERRKSAKSGARLESLNHFQDKSRPEKRGCEVR